MPPLVLRMHSDIHLPDLCPQDLITPEIRSWHAWKEYFSAQYEKCGNSPKMTHRDTIRSSLEVHFYGNFVVVIHRGKEYLGTYEGWLAVKGLVDSHFAALLYARLADAFQKYPGRSLYLEAQKFLALCRKDLYLFKNSFYNIMKAVPSTIIATILRDHERTCLGDYPAIIHAEGRTLGGWLLPWLTEERLDIDAAKILLELSGLVKSVGFPYINTDASSEVFLDALTSEAEVDHDAALEVRNVFVKTLCKSYFKRHHKWPAVAVEVDVPRVLQDAIESETWGEIGNSGWPADWFQYIELDNCLQFDYHIDLSELMSDKATSAGKLNFMICYDRQAFVAEHGHRAPPSSSRNTRVLEQYICQVPRTLKEVFLDITEGTLDPNLFAIEACFKEREHKIDTARPFAKMTFQLRLWQTATESNISSKVFPFIKQQTMSLNEREYMLRVAQINRQLGPGEPSHVFITFDFKRWCLSFSHAACQPTFASLDAAFGLTGIYDFSHIYPYKCHVVIQDRFRPPDSLNGLPRDGDRCTNSPKRLMEGMRQKGWTLITAMVLEKCAVILGTDAHLMGQGDNQTALLKIPPQSVLARMGLNVSEFAQNYIDLVSAESSMLGLTLKDEETWMSTMLFEYSKKYHFLGVEVSTGLKRASRIGTDTNDGIQTLANRVSSVHSAGVTLAGVDDNPGAAYTLACIETAIILHDQTPKLKLTSICAQLLVTRDLGGWPVNNYAGYAYRGQMDRLSANIAVVLSAHHSDHEVSVEMSKLIDLCPARRRDPLLLVKDPYSINIDVPQQGENKVKRLIADGLPSVVKNPDILPLFAIGTDLQESQIVSDLMTLVPLNPRVMNHVYKRSNLALKARLQGRFASSKTIRTVITRENEELTETDFQATIAICDHNIIGEYLTRFENDPKTQSEMFNHYTGNECSANIAQHLRVSTWRLPIEGITMPCPSEQFELVRWEDGTADIRRSFLIIMTQSIT